MWRLWLGWSMTFEWGNNAVGWWGPTPSKSSGRHWCQGTVLLWLKKTALYLVLAQESERRYYNIIYWDIMLYLWWGRLSGIHWVGIPLKEMLKMGSEGRSCGEVVVVCDKWNLERMDKCFPFGVESFWWNLGWWGARLCSVGGVEEMDMWCRGGWWLALVVGNCNLFVV